MNIATAIITFNRHRIFLTFLFSLNFVITSCSYINYHHDSPRMGENVHAWNVRTYTTIQQPYGSFMTTYNLNHIPPYNNDIGKTLHFYSPCYLELRAYEQGYDYLFREGKPPRTSHLLLCIPVSNGKIIDIKNTFWHKNGFIEFALVRVLLEFRLPHINDGAPIYLSYQWNDDTVHQRSILSTPLKRAPWQAPKSRWQKTIRHTLDDAERFYQYSITQESLHD